MPNSLSDWPRQYFQERGGKPFLFYVVYGKFGTLPGLDATRYRSAGIYPKFELSHYDATNNPDVLKGIQEGYLWDELQTHRSDVAEQIAQAEECVILRGEIDDCETLNYMRDSVGLVTFLLDNGGVAVYDPLMFKWWTPDIWREQISAPASPVPRHHVVILTSDEEDSTLTWFHTRGMRKFGRPDLSIHDVPIQYREAVIDLCNRFIELQAFGGIIPDGQGISMKSLPDGMVCHHGGDLDDPDFNNVHVEITWT